jgi:hypothetical protein
MKNPPALQHAITELAELNARQHIATSITDDDAKPYVDADVLGAWWDKQCDDKYDAEAFGEALERLTDHQRNQLVRHIFTLHPAALRWLREVFVAHVANHVASEATELQSSLEPSDDELSHPRALRSLARQSAAYDRIGRSWPL